MSRAPIAVVGVGEDGCASLPSRAMNAIAGAQVLVGAERLLAFFPEHPGERVVLGPRLTGALDRIEALTLEHRVCVLASGDPLFFGIGGLLVRRFGAAQVEVVPQPSSVQLAFARAGLPWADACFLSLHGRAPAGFVARARRANKVACLTDAENTPARLARRLLDYGERHWRAWVCERLGGPGERVRAFDRLEALADVHDVDPLNVLLLARPPDTRPPPLVPYLPDEDFARRMPKLGLITKREIRALILANLGLREDSVIWDVGAGSGSVAIEAALIACAGRAFAVEVDATCVAMCRDNALAHGADNLEVVHGRAPAALAGLPEPDAVFVGGSKGSLADILAECFGRGRPGGRVVVSAVTVDNVAAAQAGFRALGIAPELTLVNVSRGRPLAGYLRYEALNPIHLFAATRPPVEAAP